jgi:hypothetical protein
MFGIELQLQHEQASSLISLTNKKAQFTVALKRYLQTHYFNSIEKFVLIKRS